MAFIATDSEHEGESDSGGNLFQYVGGLCHLQLTLPGFEYL